MEGLTAFGVFYQNTSEVNRAKIKQVFDSLQITRATLRNYRISERYFKCMKAYVAERLIESVPELKLILTPELEPVDTEPLGV